MIQNPSNLEDLPSLTSIFETKDSYVHFVDNSIFFKQKKGCEINLKREISLLIEAVDYFGNMPFVYISNKCQHSPVFLNEYRHLEMLPNLIGIAIVLDDESNAKEIYFDTSLFKNPLKVFKSLDGARKWSKKISKK